MVERKIGKCLGNRRYKVWRLILKETEGKVFASEVVITERVKRGKLRE